MKVCEPIFTEPPAQIVESIVLVKASAFKTVKLRLTIESQPMKEPFFMVATWLPVVLKVCVPIVTEPPGHTVLLILDVKEAVVKTVKLSFTIESQPVKEPFVMVAVWLPVVLNV